MHLPIELVHRHPTFQEATSWLFTKRGRFESGTTRTGNKSKSEVRTGFAPGVTACKPNALTTGRSAVIDEFSLSVRVAFYFERGKNLALLMPQKT